jgi:hypothetical protein
MEFDAGEGLRHEEHLSLDCVARDKRHFSGRVADDHGDFFACAVAREGEETKSWEFDFDLSVDNFCEGNLQSVVEFERFLVVEDQLI